MPTPKSNGWVALIELLVVPLCVSFTTLTALLCTAFPGSRWMLTTYCRLPYIHISTVHDFHNDNVNVTKCISCFRLNLKLKPCFGLHVPIAAKPNAFCTYIMGGLRHIVTFIRLIIYRCTNMGVQCMQSVTDNVQMPFVQRAGLQYIGNMFHIILLWMQQRNGKQALGSAYSYCVEYTT